MERNKLPFSSQKSRAFMPPSHRGGGALANTSRMFGAQVWRPRHTPRADSSNNRSPLHRALARNHDPHARALSDSQRTISDNLGNPEQGEITHQSKAHISEEPTSRERGPLIHNAPLIIRDQEARAQGTHSSIPARLAESSAGKEKQIAGNIDMELDFDYGHDLDGQDLETPLTELEKAEVDNLVKETELLEMNAMLMATDDLLGDELLGDTPDDNAEQIEAISQLSPANAEHTMEMQVDQQHTNVSQDAPNVKNRKRSASNIRTAIASTEKAPTPAKGYLKKHISRSPDIKGVMASKKLHYRRGRASPKKKAPVGSYSGPTPPPPRPRAAATMPPPPVAVEGGYGAYDAYITAATRYTALGAPTLYDNAASDVRSFQGS
uniref:Uncharacterized protein n=1 Tax=Brassica oleracea var. oleracea TaxID=109376 RepID=A0A0D3A1C4_BRAOL